MESETELLFSMVRLTLEFRAVGFQEKLIKRALHKAADSARGQLRAVKKVLEWPESKCRTIAKLFDQIEEGKRAEMQYVLLEEEMRTRTRE